MSMSEVWFDDSIMKRKIINIHSVAKWIINVQNYVNLTVYAYIFMIQYIVQARINL